MYSLWGMHVIHFLVCLRIYDQKKLDGLDPNEVDDAFTSSDDVDTPRKPQTEFQRM